MSRLFVADRIVGRGVADDADAILVRAGRIAAIGAAAELRRPDLPEERFPGCTITAGLRDAHLHPVPYAAALSGIVLKDATDLNEVLDRLREAAATIHGPVIGMRLDDETLAERRLPTRHDLDRAVPDRPVLLRRYCGHIAVANTAALDLAGIDPDTPDPPGGSLDRDEEGTPTGVLRETAIDLVTPALDGTRQVDETTLLAAFRGLAGLGLTSVGSMLRVGDGPWADLGDEVALVTAIGPEIPIRVHGYVIADSPQELENAAERLRDAGPLVSWAGIKLFADGSLGGHTAAMVDAYLDAPGETGLLRLTDRDVALARAALDMGGRVAVHGIGDRACHAVLDVFETLIERGADPSRLRLEHASVLLPEDIERIADLGIVACVQPAFLGSETAWLERRVGPDRLALTYPFHSLLTAGARLAGGSDAPVEPPHPLLGMALARDRAGIWPAEGLDPASALGLFTDGAAVALGEPAPLAIGSPADLVVLDVDPLTASPEVLREGRVLCTMVAGTELVADPDQGAWRG